MFVSGQLGTLRRPCRLAEAMEWEVSKVVRPANGKTILMVEDEENIRVLFQHVLASAGYTVDSTGTVAGAMRFLHGRTYDLVIADDRLPDGRGLEIADTARAKGIEAVVLTGYALKMAKEEIARYDLLLKPMRPIELVSEVERRIAAQSGPAILS